MRSWREFGLAASDIRLILADADGLLINPLSPSRIQPAWREALERALSVLAKRLPEAPISAYVRGSVASGTAVAHVSDIDLIAITATAVADETIDDALSAALATTHPFATRVEIDVAPIARLLGSDADPTLRFKLKTLALHVTGPNHQDEIPPFALHDPAIRLYAPHITYDLDMVVQEIKRGANDRAYLRRRFAWLARRMLRAAFELAMSRLDFYTRDAALCGQIIACLDRRHARLTRQMTSIASGIGQEDSLSVAQEFSDVVLTALRDRIRADE